MPSKGATLLLVRHAVAEERGDEWPDDHKRPLTSKGTARMRDVVAGIDSLELDVSLVLTSPLTRAKQTADLLFEGLSPKPKLDVLPELAPGNSPAKLADALAQKDGGTVALVGHEPGLGELAAWLIGAKSPLPFKKGGVCRIDVPKWPPTSGSGQLVWLATPKMLRALS